jgi:hypothetical protein
MHQPELLGRGVYRAPYLSPDGHAILYAVDHHHTRIAERYLMLGDNPFTVNAELWEILNHVDPVSAAISAGAA